MTKKFIFLCVSQLGDGLLEQQSISKSTIQQKDGLTTTEAYLTCKTVKSYFGPSCHVFNEYELLWYEPLFLKSGAYKKLTKYLDPEMVAASTGFSNPCPCSQYKQFSSLKLSIKARVL